MNRSLEAGQSDKVASVPLYGNSFFLFGESRCLADKVAGARLCKNVLATSACWAPLSGTGYCIT